MSLLNKIKKWLSTDEIAEPKTENTSTNNQATTPELQPENLPVDDAKTEESQPETSPTDDAKTEESQPETSPADDAKTEESQPETSPADDAKTEESQPETSPTNNAKTEELQPKIVLPKLMIARDFSRPILEKLINSHKIYHDGLVEALRGNNPAIYNAPDNSAKKCATLGCWLTEHEQLLAPYSEYAVVVDMHNAFHDRASFMLERHRHGNFAEAVLMKKDVAILSDEIEQALTRLYQQIQAA